MADTRDASPRELTNVLHMEESIPQRPDGAVSYSARYRQRSKCYECILSEDGVALAKATTSRVRAIAYLDLGVRDWDVSVAYFAFRAHDVDKLEIKHDIPYFMLEAVKKYIADRDFARKSIWAARPTTESICKSMRRRAFNGGALCRGREENIYSHGMAWANGRLFRLPQTTHGGVGMSGIEISYYLLDACAIRGFLYCGGPVLYVFEVGPPLPFLGEAE